VNISLGALAAMQLVASLIGQLAILRIVGIGVASDAYIAAQAVPVVLAALIAASLQSLWLPRLARAAGNAPLLRTEQGIAQGQTLKVLLGISLPLWIASPLWVRWAFPGFSDGQLAQVVTLGGPLLAAGVLNGQSILLTVGLRAQKRFIGPELVSLGGTLVMIAVIVWLVPLFGISAAPWITFARAAGVYGIQLVQAGRPPLDLRASETSREVWRQLRPLIGGSIFIKTGPLVDRFWSSQAGGGAVTALNLAQLAVNSIATILERAILVPLVPEFARRIQRGDIAGLRQAYHRSLLHIGLCVGAVGVALLGLYPVWDGLLLALLRIQPAVAREIWLACMLLLAGLFVSVGGSAAVAVFYAFGETRIPVVIGVGGFIASLVFKGLLFQWFGILGVAAGASLYLVLNMTLYHVAVVRRLAQAAAQ
jgi:putative peptidoglycan lipid II flippase